MKSSKKPITFESALAPLFRQHIAEKRSFGCRYDTAELRLRAFDRFLCERGVARPDFTRDLVKEWISKRPNESITTQAGRTVVLRQFCRFLERQGYTPFIPSSYQIAIPRTSFAPHIFSESEIQALLKVMDALHPHPRAVSRAIVVPLVFRLLYGCGLRISEALHLRIRDVDWREGVLTIRETKFLKDRLVPVAPSLADRLRRYADTFPASLDPDAFFFPAFDGGVWTEQMFYGLFRRALYQCGIPHGGRGHGPRIHDLRHTFACHRLARWLREGVPVDLALPILSTYLGHESVDRTQRYLHLFPALYPDITARLSAYCGSVIPTEEVMA